MVVAVSVPRKRDVALAFIVERIARSGVAPSLEEIGAELDVSKTRVKALVAQLEHAGIIYRTPGAQRSIRVHDVGEARATLDVALDRLGWIRGSLQAAVPFPQEHLPLLPDLEHLPPVQPGAST